MQESHTAPSPSIAGVREMLTPIAQLTLRQVRGAPWAQKPQELSDLLTNVAKQDDVGRH